MHHCEWIVLYKAEADGFWTLSCISTRGLHEARDSLASLALTPSKLDCLGCSSSMLVAWYKATQLAIFSSWSFLVNPSVGLFLCVSNKCYIIGYFGHLWPITGNLYTHARHHTGMLFCCTRCCFKTANRSHLAEHEQTHRHDQRTCELCCRDYKTSKSLINHTRKYHAQTSAGANYLARLQVCVLTVHIVAVCTFTNSSLLF